jgi:hypothetical protein
MRMKRLCIVVGVFIAAIIPFAFVGTLDSIPKTWDMDAIKHFHLPPPDSAVKVVYPSEEYYNSLPEHVIYKIFPVYLREF